MTVKNRASVTTLIVASFIAGIIFTTAGANWLNKGDLAGSEVAASESNHDRVLSSPGLHAIDEAFVTVADRVNPAVVQIRSEKIVQRQFSNPFNGFFGMPDQSTPNNMVTKALGSGVIVSKDGYIVTNHHVIDGAESLEVQLFDRSFHTATVVGTDPNSDLAVIRINVDDLPTVQYAEESNVRVGQWVMAFGSPLSEDLGNSVSAGIVSALHRTSTSLSSLNGFSAFIQTDTAINPGNSGGPLVNLFGKLIGINSAILSQSGGNQGIGFAIPVDVVKNVTSQIIENGFVERGFLGVGFSGISESLSSALNIPRGAAQITDITDDSPAKEAGLTTEDIIISVNGYELTDFNELRTTIANLKPGESVQLDILRDNDRLTKNVILGRRTDFVDEPSRSIPGSSDGPHDGNVFDTFGFSVSDLTPSVRNRLNVGEDIQGVVISGIRQDSDAYLDSELRQGDIILELDRKVVSSIRDFRRVLTDLDSGKSALVRYYRPSAARSFLTAIARPE